MNATRAVFWMLGIVFILAGAYMLYFEAGLNRWVSIGVVTAGVLLFVGLAVMTFATGAPADRPAKVVRTEPSTTVVDSHPTYVERDERRRP